MTELWAIGASAAFTLLGTAAMGLAVAWFAASLLRIATADRGDEHRADPLELRRREILRGSKTYLWFEPLVDELAVFAARRFPVTVEKLNRGLPLVNPLPWTGEEFVAVKMVEGMGAFFAGAFLGHVLFGEVIAPFVGVFAAVFTPRIVVNGLLKKADRYRATVRNRLPFVVDLVSLMVLSGATLRACLKTATAENRGHPLGEELARVWVGMDNGLSQADALRAMADRVNEPDLTEVATVLIAADEKGGKELPAMLDRMAAVLRTRRVQYMERDSERAKVMITWPGMVIMIACLLIVAAVFVLPATAK